MKKLKPLFFAFLFLASLSLGRSSETSISSMENFFASEAGYKKPVLLLELFTSQGCSSCPPADKLLSKLEKEQDERLELVGLAYHVDYWNRLGWTDPFSDSMYSQRQKDYGKAMEVKPIYTPQLILNGVYQVVGSKEDVVKAHIDSLAPVVDHHIPFSGGQSRKQKRRFYFKSNEQAVGKWLNIAVRKSNNRTMVPKGENKGKVLLEDATVVYFEQIEIKDPMGGSFILGYPGDLNDPNIDVVLFMQDPVSWQILGTDLLDLHQF